MIHRRRFLTKLAGGSAAVIAVPLSAQPGGDPTAERFTRDWMTTDALRGVDRGLAYLANTANPDGSFGERPMWHGNLAVTSLAGMALMAGGHVPDRGPYGSVVTKAIEYTLSKEQRDPPGYFQFGRGPTSAPGMYSHGFVTLFLCEAYGMAGSPDLSRRLKGAIERAIQVIINSQNSEGGWRYEPRKMLADSSVTICQIMALRAARNIGFSVPKEIADRCVKYVRSCQNPDGGFSYITGQGPSAFARSAAGVTALFCAGVYSGAEIDRGLRYLMRYKPGEGVGRVFMPESYYFYGHYYAAQAMWTAGPAYWDMWFPAIRDELLRLNRGRPDGAWMDGTVCNHYATAMACIILQIGNNYLPILQK